MTHFAIRGQIEENETVTGKKLEQIQVQVQGDINVSRNGETTLKGMADKIMFFCYYPELS